MKKYGVPIAGFWHAGHFSRVRRREIATQPAAQQPIRRIIKPDGTSDPVADLNAIAAASPTKGHETHHRKKWRLRWRTWFQNSSMFKRPSFGQGGTASVLESRRRNLQAAPCESSVPLTM